MSCGAASGEPPGEVPFPTRLAAGAWRGAGAGAAWGGEPQAAMVAAAAIVKRQIFMMCLEVSGARLWLTHQWCRTLSRIEASERHIAAGVAPGRILHRLRGGCRGFLQGGSSGGMVDGDAGGNGLFPVCR